MAARNFQTRFNVSQFNERQFNGGLLSEVLSTNLIVFDGFSISDGTIMICTDLLDSGPTREIISGRVPRDDGEYVNADYWREKTIVAKGIIIRSTSTLLEAYLDTVRKNLRTRGANLDITRNSVVRRYVATLEGMDQLFAERQRYHVTICPWTATFLCKTPFSKARAYTSGTETTSVSPTTVTVINNGTYKAKSTVYVIFSAASSVTVVNIKRTNAAGTVLEEIEYSGTIAAGDAVIFDGEDRTVKKNGTQVAYTGSFLFADPGSSLFKLTITGTSFTVDYSVNIKDTFL